MTKEFYAGGPNSVRNGRLNSAQRHQKRNYLSSVTPVVLKIGVQREQSAVCVPLGKPNQAGVGKRHRGIVVTSRQDLDTGRLFLQIYCHFEYSPIKHADKISRAPTRALDQEARLGEDRLARQQRRPKGRHLLDGPAMPSVPSIEIRHKRARVDDKSGHSPKPARCLRLTERSLGPRTMPQTSAMRSWQVGDFFPLRVSSRASRTSSD